MKEYAECACVDCGIIVLRKAIVKHEVRCSKCVASFRINKFKEQGLCSLCGKVPPEEGKKRCKICREKQSKDKAKSRKTLGEIRYTNVASFRKERADNNLCTKCGKVPPIEGKRRCQHCYSVQDVYYRNKYRLKD